MHDCWYKVNKEESYDRSINFDEIIDWDSSEVDSHSQAKDS